MSIYHVNPMLEVQSFKHIAAILDYHVLDTS